jgi:gliding motility-associated-like protein
MKIMVPCLCCFLNIAVNTYAQNLVPNPGFENYNNCMPGGNLMDTSSTYFPTIKNWMSASPVSPYIFSSCLGNVPNTVLYGYHQAHSGTGFVGITTCTQFAEEDTICHLCWDDRTYVQVQLTEPLKKDTQYCVEFYVECAVISVNGTFYVSTARVGAYLSTTRPQSHFAGGPSSLLKNISPQVENAANNYITDTLHWQSIHGIYKAQGGEQWLTIGNFYTDSLTPVKLFTPANANDIDSISDMLIDDVSVTPVTFPEASKDTLLCDTSQFTKTLVAQPDGNYYQWSTGDTGLSVIIHHPGTYWFNTDFGCGQVVDSIHINFQPVLSGRLPADTNTCAVNLPLYLAMDSGFEHYTWNTGDTAQAIAISDSGTYNVHAVYACGAFSDTVHVVVYPQPAWPVAMDTNICVNTGNYPAVITGTNIHYYSSLTDSIGSLSPPLIATTNAADFTFYAAQQISGCFSGRSIEQVQIIAAPVPQVVNNLVLCAGESVQIGDVNSGYHYKWSTGDTTNLILTSTGGLFILTESNTCGNVVEQIVVKETNCGSCLFVPNVFTPNGDGNNDVFKVFSICPLNFFRCMIFDRIGEKVFESYNPLETWDGTYRSTQLNPAVFVYVITYVSANDETETLRGSVTLIR